MAKQQQQNNQQPQKSGFADIEEQMLSLWKEEKTFEKSLEIRDGAEQFVFYDGPPFANGLPHYGHVVSSIVKDAIPRYKTMRGYQVPRRFGWDCHGLPAEMKAEQDLDLGSKAAIEDYGIEKFVDYCRSSVTEFTKEWETYIDRIGRWVDFENNYYTMDQSYMESVMWAFKQLYEKGLVKEGFKVMPYCHICETSLSHFETRQDDSYRERTDTAVTVKFELESGEKLVAWTTTPWTLPANLAIAVGKDLDYAIMEGNGERLVLAVAALERYAVELEGYEQIGTKKGLEFLGQAYTPPFDYFAGHPGAHVVLHADFVTDTDGTGIAHEAPGFGEDDQKLCEDAGIEVVVPVDKQGNYTAEITAFAGMSVFDAIPGVVDVLENQHALFRVEDYVHSYPHCWRTDNPLIYRAVSSWTIDVPSLKEKLLKANEDIHWIPENVKDGMFGKWLEGVRVWNVSRDRFWGAPIPVWKTDDGELFVAGSLEEIKKYAIEPEKVTDLHKPYIDEVVIKTPSGKLARRVNDVFDCWFESGSMPFAQHGFPIKNGGFNPEKPSGDFIVEYNGQVRGWFYTLHVLGVALFDAPAYKNVLAHGVILGSDNRKMSKRLGNYPDLQHVFDTYGADALRFYLFESPQMNGETVAIDEKAMLDAQRNVFMTFNNSVRFFKMYADVDGWKAPTNIKEPAAEDLLDKWMLARLNQAITIITEAADEYSTPRVMRELRQLIDDVSNWYIRRSRSRFWKSENDSDKAAAYAVLWYTLVRVSQLLAPWAPFLSDHTYRQLTATSELPESVHLTDWPETRSFSDESLSTMELVRVYINEALAQRAEAKIKVRQPLQKLTVPNFCEPYAEIIMEEVNIKALEYVDVPQPKSVSETGMSKNSVVLNTTITEALKLEGTMRDIIRQVQNARKKAELIVDDRIVLYLESEEDEISKSIEQHNAEILSETLGVEFKSQENPLYTNVVKINGAAMTIALSKAE